MPDKIGRRSKIITPPASSAPRLCAPFWPDVVLRKKAGDARQAIAAIGQPKRGASMRLSRAQARTVHAANAGMKGRRPSGRVRSMAGGG